MIHKTFFLFFTFLAICTSGFSASEPKPSVGTVNFTNCLAESKLGKQEQASFDSLKNQLTSLIQDTEKQLTELNTKFNDTEYMDGLSPEAEEEMKNRYGTLSEEMNRYQGQYYQVMNQAQMKLVQEVGAKVQEASEAVAQNKKLNMIVNKEACFFSHAALDVTNLVVAEMDKQFETANEKK